jgi:hypothetical protein
MEKVNSKRLVMKSEHLPKKLIEKINEHVFIHSGYEYRTKNNFLKCIGLIYHHQIKDFQEKNVYVALGSAYWKKLFGGNYHEKVLRPLLELSIIESHDFGHRNIPASKTKGKSKGLVGIRYRINPDLLDDEYDEIRYINKGEVVSAEEWILNSGEVFHEELIPDKDFHIGIDHKRASNWIEDNAEQICHEFLNKDFVNSLPETLIVEYREYLDNSTYDARYSTLKSLKSLASSKGKQLFFYKERIYLADVDEFLINRIAGMKYHYKQEILKIGRLKTVDKRSDVTLRLHNYLVNFPSKILHFITINGKPTVQLDLRTSQLLLFANILNVYLKNGEEFLLQDFQIKRTQNYLKRLFKVISRHKPNLPKSGVNIHDNQSMKQSTSDVIKFIRDVLFTDFYSVLQQELGLSSRGLAKHMVFKLLFKKSNKPDKFIDLLNLRYPVVMSIIAGFKEADKGKIQIVDDFQKDNNFSVFLQCIESEIFIDKVLIPLRQQGVPCFTRHDSVVVAEGYQDEAEAHIRKVFEELDFKYNHMVDEKFWEVADYDYLEDIGYIDWLIDENELSTDFGIEGGLAENTEENNDLELNETLNRLREIGLQDNYYSHVNAEFLEEISELPSLSQQQKNLLYDDIINLQEGYNFLSPETNNFLRNLVMGLSSNLS